MEYDKDPTIEESLAHLPYDGLIAIIPETQLHPHNRNKRSKHHAILVSLGLDNPTTSQATWDGEDQNSPNQDLGNYLMNTPIRKSAASLVALGQHRLSPRHGRIWKNKGKSRLGRK